MHLLKQPVALGIALLVSSSVYAATGTPITKNLQASQIVVTASTSLRGLQVSTADVSGTGSGTKKITSVAYNLKAFPSNGGGTETVEICYSLPYSSTIGNCVAVAPGTSGSLTNFNTLSFGAGAGVWVRHTMVGGTYPASAPSTPDVITINWQY